MGEVENARRSLLQAAYTPIKAKPTNQNNQPQVVQRAWEKWSFVTSLKPSQTELSQVHSRFAADLHLADGQQAAAREAIEQAIAVINSAIPTQGTPNALRSMPSFAGVDTAALVAIGQAIVQLRQEQVELAIKAQQSLSDAFVKAQFAIAHPSIERDKLPADWKQVEGLILPEFPQASVFAYAKKTTLTPRGVQKTAQPGGGTITGEAHSDGAVVVLPTAPADPVPAAAVAGTEFTVKMLIDWVARNRDDGARIAPILDVMSAVAARPETTTLAAFGALARSINDNAQDLVYGFQQRMLIEPVGFLHLERLTFMPAGIERGELVYSLPLAPGEEAHITHKEWSNTSEEFEKIVTDFKEEFSEEGVAEKSEIAEATSSQNQHSSGFNTGVTASGGYGPVSITASVGYNVADSSSNSEQFSRNQSIAVTRKASARTKKEHKISFKVASASGTEDQSVRKIKNPFPDKETRVDYYQLIRRWRIDLYRYGIRLTYDITIPEPGSDILSKIREIQEISAALEQGFGSPDTTIPWARFDLLPDELTRDNYAAKAAQYNATVEPPPDETKQIVQAKTREWIKEEAENSQYTTFEVDVPTDYVVTAWNSIWERWAWEDEHWHFDIRTNFNSWFGKSGKLPVIVGTKFVSAFSLEVQVTALLRDTVYRAWKLRAWGAIRDAAQARYYENRQMLKERLARLTEELGSQDALSLRKIEREEVMKSVLRWLFGPTFTFVPADIPAELYNDNASVISQEVWSKVLSHGEIIKFLHQAIEWENMLYFLYPYFWSHPSRWQFKKYLDHPDSMHRVFLKSGSARVVLTIRAGFEKDFVALLETGTFDPLPPDHPYIKITEEMENYARTNYPGIPPANPEDADKKEKGKLIGSWHEYTPTSALDIEFNEKVPSA